MINGRFVVYGSAGHLKNAYGQGYLVSLLCVDNQNPLAFVRDQLPYLKFKETVPTKEMRNNLQLDEHMFEVESHAVLAQIGGLSKVFADMSKLVRDQTVTEFKVTRSSLEQVFVSFAKHQIEQPNFESLKKK